MPKSARTLRDPKRKPTHPGAILREDVLPALRVNGDRNPRVFED